VEKFTMKSTLLISLVILGFFAIAHFAYASAAIGSSHPKTDPLTWCQANKSRCIDGFETCVSYNAPGERNCQLDFSENKAETRLDLLQWAKMLIQQDACGARNKARYEAVPDRDDYEICAE
jgi:hypothetical protein